jgi:hypothetical protein
MILSDGRVPRLAGRFPVNLLSSPQMTVRLTKLSKAILSRFPVKELVLKLRRTVRSKQEGGTVVSSELYKQTSKQSSKKNRRFDSYRDDKEPMEGGKGPAKKLFSNRSVSSSPML